MLGIDWCLLDAKISVKKLSDISFLCKYTKSGAGYGVSHKNVV